MNSASKSRFGLPWILFGLLFALGLGLTIARFALGLGAVTNLHDDFPWGLWIGFDVMCGVALAAGAFTMAATVYVFHLERYRPLLRPAVLTGFLGYLLVAVGLLYDLGQPHRIWHAMVYWQPHSVMFEVAWCVMLYLTVLFLEFLPTALEGLRWKALDWLYRLLKALTLPLVIAGVVLSTLHQSSLGSLFLIVPDKLDSIWYTPLLPLHFFVSAVVAGLAMVMVESSISSRVYKRGLEIDLMGRLGLAAAVALWLYLALRLGDLAWRGQIGRAFALDGMSLAFLVEMLVGVALPGLLFSLRSVRRSSRGLFGAAGLAVFGIVLNRLNVGVIGIQTGGKYFPSWVEISITLFLVACGVAAFALAVRYFPVFAPSEGPEDAQVTTGIEREMA